MWMYITVYYCPCPAQVTQKWSLLNISHLKVWTLDCLTISLLLFLDWDVRKLFGCYHDVDTKGLTRTGSSINYPQINNRCTKFILVINIIVKGKQELVHESDSVSCRSLTLPVKRFSQPVHPPSWNPTPAMWLRLSCWVSFGSADFRAGHNNVRSSHIRSVACSRYRVNLYKPVSWSGCQKRNWLHHQVCLVPFVYSL